MFNRFPSRAWLALAVWLTGVGATAQEGYTPVLGSEKADLSYSVGVQFGTMLQYSSDRLDFEMLSKGMEDAALGRELALTEEKWMALLAGFRTMIQKDTEAGLAAEGAAFLEENAKQKGVVVLPSGLQYKVIREGSGAAPKATDTVETHYRGTFINGTEFDSSYKRNETAKFPVNGVIAGWTEALQLMKVGAKWELYIPYDLAYGPQGRQGIPPYSVLTFELELIGIVE